MIMELAANYKVLLVATSILLGGAATVYSYVDGVDERIDTVEVENEQAGRDRDEIKCMIISHDAGDNLLECMK